MADSDALHGESFRDVRSASAACWTRRRIVQNRSFSGRLLHSPPGHGLVVEKRHYTKDEIEQLASIKGIDVLLTHDAPAGVTFPRHRQGDCWVSNARGLDELLAHARPRLCFFGHHHTRVDAEVSGVRCIGLNKVARPGNLVAFEMTVGHRDWRHLGEWPTS